MKKFLLSSILTLSVSNAYAVTLEEALTNGYHNDEEHETIRNNFLDAVESYPRALAGFMPKIYASTNLKNDRTRERGEGQQTGVDTDYSRAITLNQSIFNGGSSIAALKSAKSSFIAESSVFYAQEQAAILKEIEIYLNCVEARDKYEISKISVRLNKTLLEATKEKFKLGESTATEVNTAMEGLASAEARQSDDYAKYEESKADFYRVFGLDAVELAMPTIPSGLPESLEELTKICLESNPSIISARHNMASSKAYENVAKGNLLPQVDFQVQGGLLDRKHRPRRKQKIQSVTTTLSLTVPILAKGGIEYSDIRKAKYQTKKLAIGLDSTIKKLEAQSKSSWAEFEALQLSYVAATQAVKAAEMAYDGGQHEERLGSKTIIDVQQLEEKLHKAKQTKIDSKKRIILAAYNMKSLIGQLTAQSLQLKVDNFEPTEEFKKVKTKIIGF